MLVGYARVSTIDQNPDIDTLEQAGRTPIYNSATE
jgi:DNA invertase Pin-like site-specific DNA recombinase